MGHMVRVSQHSPDKDTKFPGEHPMGTGCKSESMGFSLSQAHSCLT